MQMRQPTLVECHPLAFLWHAMYIDYGDLYIYMEWFYWNTVRGIRALYRAQIKIIMEEYMR